MPYKIATEAEAASIGGSSSSSKRLVIKSKAESLGCKVNGSYQTKQCVCLKDLEANATYNYYLTFDCKGNFYVKATSDENRYTCTVKSYKKEVKNGVEQSTEIPVPFEASLPSGIDWTYFSFTGGNSYVHVTGNYEYPVMEKTTTLTIVQSEAGGETLKVPIVQEAATVSYTSMAFTATANKTSFDKSGGTFTLTVNSRVNVYINTKPSPVETNVDKGYTISGTGSGLTNNGNTFTVSYNNGYNRSWTVTVKQFGTNKVININISQAGSGAPATSWTLTLNSDPTNPSSAWYNKVSGIVQGKAYVLLTNNVNPAGSGYEWPSGVNLTSGRSWLMALNRPATSGYLSSTIKFNTNGLTVNSYQSDGDAIVKQFEKVHCFAYLNNGTSTNLNLQGIKYLGYFTLVNEDGGIMLDHLSKDF